MNSARSQGGPAAGQRANTLPPSPGRATADRPPLFWSEHMSVHFTAATATNRSKNRKLGDAAVTYVSQQSCPRTCPFYRAGCYAEQGPMGMFVTSRLNAVKSHPLA